MNIINAIPEGGCPCVLAKPSLASEVQTQREWRTYKVGTECMKCALSGKNFRATAYFQSCTLLWLVYVQCDVFMNLFYNIASCTLCTSSQISKNNGWLSSTAVTCTMEHYKWDHNQLIACIPVTVIIACHSSAWSTYNLGWGLYRIKANLCKKI